jgi:hypothetical protein
MQHQQPKGPNEAGDTAMGAVTFAQPATAAAGAPAAHKSGIAAWLRDGRYTLPREEGPSAQAAVVPRYTPPSSDVPGVAVAVAVIAAWAALQATALFGVKLGTTPWWQVVALLLSLEFMYTGRCRREGRGVSALQGGDAVAAQWLHTCWLLLTACSQYHVVCRY